MTDVMDLSVLQDMLGFELAEDISFALPASIAIMAEPGVGKTTLGGQIIKVPEFAGKKIAYIDTEGGIKTWANDPQIMSEVRTKANPTGRIIPFQIDKTDPMKAKGILDKLLGYFDESGQKQLGALFSPAFDVDVIVIDTFSTLQEIGLQYYMATCKNAAGKKDGQAAYGELGPWTTNILWELQLGPRFGLVLSHIMDKQDKKTGIQKLMMKLSGGSKDSVASIPDLVAYVTVLEDETEDPRKPHRVAFMAQSQEVTVKNRYGFDEPMWDFSLPKLYDAIRAKINGTAAAAEAVTGTALTAQPSQPAQPDQTTTPANQAA